MLPLVILYNRILILMKLIWLIKNILEMVDVSIWNWSLITVANFNQFSFQVHKCQSRIPKTNCDDHK